MSTVKTTNLQHPSASDVGITLGADGSVVLPQGFTGGLGSNVVQTVKTDTFSTTSASYVDVTGLSLTITPTSADSKIAVYVFVDHAYDGGSLDRTMRFQLLRGATELIVPDSPGDREPTFYAHHTDGSQNSIMVASFLFLDAPATTSATTYKVATRVGTAGTGFVNRASNDTDSSATSRGVSTITAIEVAG